MLEFQRDKTGKRSLIKEGKYQVMMEWEKPYMEACIDALSPSGDVLEVGFGLGFSAERIQSYHPKSHTIIECDPTVIAEAKAWAKKQTGTIHLVEDTWQRALPRLGTFDTIFFDDYPLESSTQMHDLQSQSETAKQKIKEQQAFFDQIDQLLPHLKQISYKDDDLQAFLSSLPKGNQNTIRPFLDALLKNHNIDADQYARFSHEFGHFGRSNSPFQATHDRLFHFLEMCLDHHMNKGARFSCYIEDPSSKKQDPKFKQTLIDNPAVSYEEHWIDIDVPAHCSYYRGNRALVILVTKL